MKGEYQGCSQRGGGEGSAPPQSSEKSFFQNVEIRVENCWGGGYLTVKEDQFLESPK